MRVYGSAPSMRVDALRAVEAEAGAPLREVGAPLDYEGGLPCSSARPRAPTPEPAAGRIADASWRSVAVSLRRQPKAAAVPEILPRPVQRGAYSHSRHGTGEVLDGIGRPSRARRADVDGGEDRDPRLLPTRVRAGVQEPSERLVCARHLRRGRPERERGGVARDQRE